MVTRQRWLDRIARAWSHRTIVWLSGVRRVGKTTLARMLPDAVYLNCDLPSVGRTLADPELYFDGRPAGSVLVLDEVHRLDDPSRLLKIAADAYPGLRVLATGSSTLAATRKFRDALTGRKEAVHLCPVPWDECADWLGAADLDRRLLHGGLPEPLLFGADDTIICLGDVSVQAHHQRWWRRRPASSGSCSAITTWTRSTRRGRSRWTGRGHAVRTRRSRDCC